MFIAGLYNAIGKPITYEQNQIVATNNNQVLMEQQSNLNILNVPFAPHIKIGFTISVTSQYLN